MVSHVIVVLPGTCLASAFGHRDMIAPAMSYFENCISQSSSVDSSSLCRTIRALQICGSAHLEEQHFVRPSRFPVISDSSKDCLARARLASFPAKQLQIINRHSDVKKIVKQKRTCMVHLRHKNEHHEKHHKLCHSRQEESAVGGRFKLLWLEGKHEEFCTPFQDHFR